MILNWRIACRARRLQVISLVACGLSYLLLPIAVDAQGTSATLNGSVVDPSGAAIPQAHLNLQNADTGLKQAATSNDSGAYSISQLTPGRYTLSIERDGFRKSLQTGILLTVGEVATLNITLQVGDVTQEVTVAANEQLINVTTAEMSSVVDETSVKSLPLNGRDPSSLVLLTTGTTNLLSFPAGQSQAGGSQGGAFFQAFNAMPDESGASSGGGRQGSTFYLLDGSPNMDIYMGFAAPFPNTDATQEFRIITQNFDAQYGFSPNAVVSIQTKSGSNSFHGGIFEFVRNQDLNAANFFSHQVDPLKRNQFGGFIGGPIIANKLFFFANYQATRMSTTATSNTTYTPTAAMLGGDFSAVPVTLGSPFVGNKIDPATWSALVTSPSAPGYASYIIAKTALPLGLNPSSGQITFTGAPQISSYDEGTGRLDYAINQKQRIFWRTFTQYYQDPGSSVNGNILASSDTTQDEYYNDVLNHNWVINDSTVNNFSGYYSQMNTSSVANQLDSSGQRVCLSRYTAIQQPPGACDIEYLGVIGGFSVETGSYVHQRRSTWGVSEQLIKTLQQHTLSFGVDLHREWSKESTDYPASPVSVFTGLYSGYGLADYLLGWMTEFTQGAGEVSDIFAWNYGLYAQDQYRMNRHFTITAGLRWDPNIPASVVGGRGAAFRPGQRSTVFPNAPAGVVFPGDKGLGSGLMPTSYRYFEPRIGFNWQPAFAPHTAVRAGFGLFTGPLTYVVYNHTGDVAPFSPTFTLLGTTGPLSIANPWTGFGGKSPFPPFASVTYKPPADYSFQTPMSLLAVFSNNFRESMTQSWSLSVEQELAHGAAFHIAYVGSETYHQSVTVDQNPGIKDVRIYAGDGLGQILSIQSVGTASYHSLQASFDKQMSHGLSAHTNFTWSKVIDVASEGNPSQSGGGVTNPFDIRFNRGISDLNFPFVSTTQLLYTSPDLKAKNAMIRSLFGSWGLSAIYTLQSGRGFGIVAGGNADNSGSLQDADRADVVPGVSPMVHTGSRAHWLAQYINPAAFTDNASGTFGNSPRNAFRGPKINTADTAILKNWQLKNLYSLQFRWEMFNTFNHTSFSVPTNAGLTLSDISLSTVNFGQITSIGPIPPRVMQGALKLTF